MDMCGTWQTYFGPNEMLGTELVTTTSIFISADHRENFKHVTGRVA